MGGCYFELSHRELCYNPMLEFIIVIIMRIILCASEYPYGVCGGSS